VKLFRYLHDGEISGRVGVFQLFVDRRVAAPSRT
jgi:hypothetical protein